MPTNPTAGDVHVSRSLTNFSEFWSQSEEAFVGLRGMPNMPVDKQFDQFTEWLREDLYRDEFQEVADDGDVPEMQARLATDNYNCRVWKLRAAITDRQRANADSQINLERGKTAALMLKAKIRRENLWVAAFFVTGVWTATGSDAAPGTLWDVATATPIDDIRTAMRAISLTGVNANRITFGREAWDTFLSSDDLLSRVEGGATVERPALVQRRLIAQLFEIEEVNVLNAVEATNVKGATEVLARIGAQDDVLIYAAPQQVGLDVATAGVTFSWTGYLGATPDGVRIKRYRDGDPSKEKDWVEAQMAVDHVVTASELGFLFTGVTT